jgi:hypothetical protein
MKQVANYDPSKKLKKELQTLGQKHTKSYPFLEDLVNFMENPLSKSFYQKYMKDSETLSQMCDLLFLYEKIDPKDTHELNGFQKIALLMEIIMRKDNELRLKEETNRLSIEN